MSIFKSNYAGTCRTCGQRFPAGTLINWQRGLQPAHASAALCQQAAAAPTEGAEGAEGSAPKAKPKRVSAVDKFAEMHTANMEATREMLKQHGEGIQKLASIIAAPRKAIRGPDGRISGTVADLGSRH